MTSILSAIAEFLLDRRSFGRKPATIRFYQTHLGAMAEFMRKIGVETLAEVCSRTLRAWFAHLQKRELSHNTVAAYDRAARAFFAFCHQEGWSEHDPMASRPRIRQTQRRPDTLALDDVRALLHTCDGNVFGIRDRAIMLLMLDTGLRAGEVVGLTLEDLQFKDHSGLAYVRAEIAKSGRGRTVPFQGETASALRKWLAVRPAVDGPVFVSSDGVNLGRDALTTSGLNQLMRRHAEKAGIEEEHGHWCHIWRHTFAKRYVLAGGDLETLRQILGHTSLDTVQVYLGFKMQDIEDLHARLSPVRQLFSEC